MSTNHALNQELVQLRAQFSGNDRLRLEFYSMMSKLLREHGVDISYELLLSLKLTTDFAEINARIAAIAADVPRNMADLPDLASGPNQNAPFVPRNMAELPDLASGPNQNAPFVPRNMVDLASGPNQNAPFVPHNMADLASGPNQNAPFVPRNMSDTVAVADNAHG